MTIDDRDALDALQRRLSHTEAIARLVVRNDDTELGEALRGIALLLSDANEQLDSILKPRGAA